MLSYWILLYSDVIIARDTKMYEDTGAIHFGPDLSNRLAGHGPKGGHKNLHCSSE